MGNFRERKLCVEAGKMQESLTGLGVWGKFGGPHTCGEGWELKVKTAHDFEGVWDLFSVPTFGFTLNSLGSIAYLSIHLYIFPSAPLLGMW